MKRILITISGKDKPGIIAKVSGLLFARGCNLEDVSMTLLEGQFAMMMTVCLAPKTPVESVLAALNLLKRSPWSMDSHVTFLRGEVQRGKKHATGSQSLMVTAFGKDRTGIVYEVSRALAGLQVNITDLDSRILGAGNKATYAMLLEVEVPGKVKLAKLKDLLNRIARKIKIEIHVKPLERVSF